MKNNTLEDILSVAGGNKDIQIGIDKDSIYLAGAIILVAVFIGVFAGVMGARKLS